MSGGQPRILLTDDIPSRLAEAAALLEGEGFVVERAAEMRQLRAEHDRLLQLTLQQQARITSLGLEFDSFAGRIAHDLQSVMQIIEGFAAALRREAAPSLGERGLHFLERISATSVHGNQLVNELLAYSRLGSGELELRPVALDEALVKARRSLDETPSARAVQWDVGRLPWVQGDPWLLQQALVHLLSNAIKFSTPVAAPRIQVRAVAHGDDWEIQVSDNGVGFDPAYVDRLFRPFERLHGPKEFEGNGMGLASVKRIVDLHGGSVRAEGRPGAGAMISFRLPGAPPPRSSAAEPEPPAASTVPSRLRVLLIDDDPLVLLALRNTLEIDGHLVHTAPGGQLGLQAFDHALQAGVPYDVVISDWGMPHVNGRDVARAVKQARAQTTTIILTGGVQAAGAERHQLDHVDQLIQKPVRLARMRQALAACPGGSV